MIMLAKKFINASLISSPERDGGFIEEEEFFAYLKIISKRFLKTITKNVKFAQLTSKQ